MSRRRGARNAARMADSVISLNVTRTKRPAAPPRSCRRCQAIASPSRSQSVASTTGPVRPARRRSPRHDVAPVRRDLPGRLPPRVWVETEHRAALPPTATRRKIPKVAEARPHEVVLTEAALYRPALGRRLDDDERGHYDPPCTPRTYASAAGNR